MTSEPRAREVKSGTVSRSESASAVLPHNCPTRTLLTQDPFFAHVFVFRDRRGEIIKLLWWDGLGNCRQPTGFSVHVMRRGIQGISSIEPVLRRPSKSRCACAACASG